MEKTKIEVEISAIEVDDSYYSFDYKIYRDGNLVMEETYESDHAWRDDKEGFKKTLKENSALSLVLEEYAESLS